MATGRVDVLAETLRRHGPYTSLLAAGFVDPEMYPPVARMLNMDLFLGDRHGCLRFFSDEEAGGCLRVEERHHLSFREAVLEEPDIEPVFVDLTLYHLADGDEVKFDTASLYLDPDTAGNRSCLHAIALHRADGRALLIDAFSFSGIRLGNEADIAYYGDDLQRLGGPPIVIRL